jgi:hypothetical protein
MKVFKNYNNEDCYLTVEQEEHIQSRHPEASEQFITQCLMAPMEVRKSSSHSLAHLYYVLKTKDRFFCVVLKCCSDGNFISTAYTTTRMKNGKIIYKEGV